MKKLILLAVLLGTCFNYLTAQCNSPEPPAVNDCENAPLICQELFYYCSSLPFEQIAVPFPGCPNNVANNAHYLKFIAGSTFISFDIYPANCTIGSTQNQGMHASIFEHCYAQEAVVANCEPNNSPFNLSSSQFIVGNTYYFLLDGYGGSICDYEIIMISGSTQPPVLDNETPSEIIGPDFVDNGETYTFATNVIPFVTEYIWTVTGGVVESYQDNAVIVQVTDDTNFEICVQGTNDCSQTTTTCQVFEMNPDIEVIEATICEGECFEFNNTLFCDPGSYDVEVDNGNGIDLVLLIITQIPAVQTEVTEELCFGDCLDFSGQLYCQTGTYSITLVSNQGCDSLILLNLIVYDPNEPMITIGSSGDLDCQNTSTTLSASSSIPNATYQWSGPGINADNENEQTPEITEPGLYSVVVTIASGCSNTATIEVLGEPGLSDITITGNEPLNCNNNENTISASGTIAGLEYEWSGPGGFLENGPEITVEEAGEYILIVTAPNGCMTMITVNVEENNEPFFVDPGPNRHIQCEFILTLDAPGAAGTNIVYEWTTLDGNILNGGNTLNPVVNRNGTYTLTAFDPLTGCSGSADMIVYADMAIIEDEYLETTCEVSILQIDATDSYNGADAFIQWTTSTGNIVEGANTLMPTVDAAGTYQLVMSRPGCLSFATVTVIDNAIAPAIDIEASSTVITCTENVTLTAVTDATDVVYTWFRFSFVVSNQSSIPVNTPGLYTLVIDAPNGCSSSMSIEIEEDRDPDDIFIYGDIVLDCSLNGTGTLNAEVDGEEPFYEIIWFTSGGEIVSNNFGTTISINGPGLYCADAYNPNTGCTVSDCVEVIESSDILINSVVTDVTCPNANDGSIEITISGGTAPYIFEWNGAGGIQTTQNIYDLAPGVYNVVVMDGQGCQAFQTFIIEAVGTENVTADAGADQALDCLTDFIVLDGGASVFPPGTTFLWETNNGTILAGANTLFPSVNSTGTYILTIFSPEGCEDSDAVIVTDYSADAGPSQVLDCNNTSVQLQGGNAQAGATYEWTTADGNIVMDGNALNPTVDQAGTYTLLVTDNAGCTYTDETTVSTDFEIPDASVVEEEVALEICGQGELLQGQSNTPGVFYSWSGPGGGGNQADILVETPGTYTLTVTASNGCTNTASVQVVDETFTPIISSDRPTQYLNCFNGEPLLLDLSIETLNTDIHVDWNSSNGNIVEIVGNSVTVDEAGIYEVTVVVNGINCSASYAILVETQDAAIQVETIIASCGIPDATATVNTEFIHDPEFIWSTGASTASISGLAPDIYTVTVTSPTSTCDEVRTVEIIQDPSCFVIISGYIYDDATLSCDQNGNVEPKAGVVLTISPEDLETTTDQEGYYEFLVPPGDYSITPQLISPFVVECPAESINVSVPAGSSGSDNNNFFIKALSGFDLYVTASSGAANAGTNQFYQISFCNNWFTTIFGTVEFTHDPLLEFDPVAAGASSYDPDTYTAVWEYEDLSFFECEFLSFPVFVPANIPDGTVINSSVIILPTQGDIAPANNSTTWTRTVNNASSSGSTTAKDADFIESNHQGQITGQEAILSIKQYPNPFSNQTNIEFVLQAEEEIEVQIYDANGRLIRTYTGFERGFNLLNIEGHDLPAKGIYFYKIVGPTVFASGRMIKN